MSFPQIWNTGKEKDREKERVGGRLAKLNAKKRGRDLEQEIKKHKRHFLLEEQFENFVAPVTKNEMRNACGHPCKVKMSGSKKK